VGSEAYLPEMSGLALNGSSIEVDRFASIALSHEPPNLNIPTYDMGIAALLVVAVAIVAESRLRARGSFDIGVVARSFSVSLHNV
jgi:hypothetical protein